jgi:hypothetical protein
MRMSLLLATIVACTLASSSHAQETPDLITPKPEHAQMAREVGVWDAESTMWMTPDAEAVTSKGVETVTMMGKFWLVGEFVGDMMGEEFRGRSQMTFDPITKKYVGTWIDTMAPVTLTMTGDYDASTHTLTMMMNGIDPMTGKPSQWKTITHYVDENTKTFEMHSATPGEPGKWWKTLEIKYAKRK